MGRVPRRQQVIWSRGVGDMVGAFIYFRLSLHIQFLDVLLFLLLRWFVLLLGTGISFPPSYLHCIRESD
jgi:hypothetical protein